MGKEIAGLSRENRVTRGSFPCANKRYIQWIIARQWSRPTSFPTSADISDDGHVKVIVKQTSTQANIIFRGLRQSGNTYRVLVKLMKSKKLLSKRGSVGLFIRKGFMWEPVSDRDGMFSSGSYVLAVVNKK